MKTILLLLLSLAPTFAFAEAIEWREVGCCDDVDPPVKLASPGNSGPNAFYFMWHVEDARIIGDQIFMNVSYRPSRDLRGQWTNAGLISVVVPFSEFASVEFSQMVEKWELNDRGVADFGATKRSGTTLNDFIATVKFNLFRETKNRPAITLKGVIKTASGAAADSRNTDTAGYEVGVLFAKDVLIASGALRKVRLLAELGFFAWDDGIHSQNDAYHYGFATQFLFHRDFTVDVGIHGYTGWRKNGDAPRSLYLEGRKVFAPRVTGFGSVDLGIDSKKNPSSNPVTFSAGLKIAVGRRYKPRK